MTERTSDAIRVLYLIGGRRIGGMETHLLTLASSLPSSVRCIVCCVDASDDYLARLTRLGIVHVNLACSSLVRPRAVKAVARLKRLVSQFAPHVVHSYGFSGDVLAALLRVTGCAARIVTSRRGEERNARHQAVRRLVNRLSERIVCVSSETAAFVGATESPAPHLIEVIPNGVAPHPANRARDGHAGRPIRFGTLGTVKPIKGPDLLVDAFLQFPAAQPVELVIAGLIDRAWAEALRDRAGRDPRIHFAGRTSAPRDFLAELDVFVLPSRSEGMSNALLEAMASGLPCIATDVGSNRSVLAPAGEPAGGLIVDAAASSLHAAMRDLAADAGARARYGSQGAALVRARYTIDGMVRQYERLYRAVIGARPGAGNDEEHVRQGMTVDA